MGRFLGGNQVAVVGYILEKRKNVKGWMDAAMDVHERASLDLYRYLIRLLSFGGWFRFAYRNDRAG